jgi:uncharacterized membrane protein
MAETNPNSRLEAFCDGVFAIALTLLIIDIKIPSTVEINNTADFWLALKHIAPSIVAFLLSFIVILITWVNHHNTFKGIHKSSSSFIYANGFLLLIVVFMPFPTSLMGEYLLTDHAAPAVILYDSALTFQALSWILLFDTALKNNLAKNEKSIQSLHSSRKFGYFALLLYSVCAITACWFPVTIATITFITWVFWLIWGIMVKHE